MGTVKTKFGVLKGVTSFEFYNNGGIKKCKLNEYNEVQTAYGVLVPQYEEDEIGRRKFTKSLTFYENGNLESISLQCQTEVQVAAGSVPAETILFYETGSIKRIFPLDGRITGFWSEDDEYGLAKEIELKVSFGSIKKKFVALYFYEEGPIKSLTFWVKDSIVVPTPVGAIETRIGISFYENGELRSLEPKKSTVVETPIGLITAFNTDAIGIHGDSNSLCFYPDGRIKSLLTSTDRIIVTDTQGDRITMEPGLAEDLLESSAMAIVPLPIEFYDNSVRFNKSAETEYKLGEATFTTRHFPLTVVQTTCGSCSDACGSCG